MSASLLRPWQSQGTTTIKCGENTLPASQAQQLKRQRHKGRTSNVLNKIWSALQTHLQGVDGATLLVKPAIKIIHVTLLSLNWLYEDLSVVIFGLQGFLDEMAAIIPRLPGQDTPLGDEACAMKLERDHRVGTAMHMLHSGREVLCLIKEGVRAYIPIIETTLELKQSCWRHRGP